MGATKRSAGRPAGTLTQPNGLTERQEAIVRAVQASIRERGYPPSMREIGAATGLSSTSSVSHQIRSLVKKSVLRKDPHTPRAYSLTPSAAAALESTDWAFPDQDDEADAVRAPLVGRIAAGVPITAEQHVDGSVMVPRQMTGGGSVFALTVQGDSMIGAHIVEGDTVIVRSQPDAQSGEVVAAMIDGEATIKRFKRDGQGGGEVWLLPENPAYAPIDASNATILGKVVTVLRSL
ncbi:transcriptional repressor LexA (plasmid) [Streptomyces sp. SDT5-1]|uniref:transcriptional repressor LexA n=1 Tax=Streptomyces sp. SDT5-1 TaxID=3406418 RepID=UPI003FD04836